MRRAVAPLLLSLLAAPAALGAVSRVEVAVGVPGHLGGGGELPSAEHLEVRLDGGRIVDYEILPRSARIGRVVLYLDRASARPASLQRVARSLVEQIDRVAGLAGGLEIVEADPEPTLLPPARSREELEQRLNQIMLRRTETDAVPELRREFLSELSKGETPAETLAEEAYRLELELRRASLDRLLAWVAGQGRSSGPRLILLLNDNLGLEAEPFYRRGLGDASDLAVRIGGVPDPERLAQTLSVYGWTLVPLLPGRPSGDGRIGFHASPEAPIGFRLGLGGDRDRLPEDTLELELDERLIGAVERAAAVTGGELLTAVEKLAAWIEGFRNRPVLRLELSELPVGESARLHVAGRAGRDLVAPRVVGVSTPEAIAEMRLRRAIAGESGGAELRVRSAIEFDPERLGETTSRYEVRVDLFPLREGLREIERGTFRVTVGIRLQSEQLLVRHELVRGVDVASLEEWRYEGVMRVPAETDGAVVLVELLETGDWGESFASFVRASSAASATDVTDGPAPAADRLLPERRAVRLQPPPGSVLYGKLRVSAEVDRGVERLVYFLDGKRVASQRRAPWSVAVDLGPTPRRRTLDVIAYGADGVELGRDRLVLNEARRGFAVHIVEPPPGRRVGPVDVEAEVEVPGEAAVDRVDFYWQEELVSTVRRPPWRQRLFIPLASQPGFIRVVAHLSDGRMAEDVVLMNADLFAERLTVKLIELYVVVTDHNGQPVRDLEEEDFVILEEGEPQAIETFSRAGDLPITVGLALDSSLSLFVKMSAVQEAAAGFVDGLIDDRDQAFLVGFSSRPRVVQAVTADLDQIVEGIRSLTPQGTTALWEAVVLSLLQLQETAGRKALVVFYDGDDEDEDFSFSTAMKLARRVGVPIYLIVMNNSAARSGGRGFATKNRAERLERIARAGGGRVFYVRTDEDLRPIFRAIREELRSHYLLAYYPEPAAESEGEAALVEEPRWRPIEVLVRRPGLDARTLAGYEKR